MNLQDLSSAADEWSAQLRQHYATSALICMELVLLPPSLGTQSLPASNLRPEPHPSRLCPRMPGCLQLYTQLTHKDVKLWLSIFCFLPGTPPWEHIMFISYRVDRCLFILFHTFFLHSLHLFIFHHIGKTLSTSVTLATAHIHNIDHKAHAFPVTRPYYKNNVLFYILLQVSFLFCSLSHCVLLETNICVHIVILQ